MSHIFNLRPIRSGSGGVEMSKSRGESTAYTRRKPIVQLRSAA
jgi:hypothetical protein